MSFDIIPAIDVRGGRIVRLAQGDYARETAFAADPLAQAFAWASQGARWLHLVDLDAAREGGYTLQPLLSRLCAESGLQVQPVAASRSEAAIAELLALGAARVVVGTVAAREPGRVCAWLERFGAERIVLALDVRREEGRWRVLADGWTGSAGTPLEALLEGYSRAGARHLLCTDASRDGMLSGFNVALYGEIARCFPGLRLQASGGVRDLDDLRAARASGAGAAILGRALLEGRIEVAEALAC